MWHRRLQGLGFILLGTGIMLAAVLAVITGPILWDLALPILNLSSNMEWVWDVLRYGSAALVLFIAVSLLYRWLPNVTQQWRDIIPGALFACSAWLVLATLYSYFLTNVGDFTLVYGSLSGIIISMLFFFLNRITSKLYFSLIILENLLTLAEVSLGLYNLNSTQVACFL